MSKGSLRNETKLIPKSSDYRENMNEEIKQPRNMDLVPMTFSIEKYVELEVDVMVHKDMLKERKSSIQDHVFREWEWCESRHSR